MNDKRGPWYLISMFSAPMLLLGLTGLFGEHARSEAEVAFGDWATYGRIVLMALALIGVVAVVFLAKAIMS